MNEYIEDEKNVGTNAKPAPSNVLFPGAAEIDLSVSGDSSDNGEEKEDGKELIFGDFMAKNSLFCKTKAVIIN